MFNEKKKEWSSKRGTEIEVWQSPKYEQSKEKALEIIKKYDNIREGDFWILMNETKSGKMAYTGLIISHNACLKLNDHLTDRFRPECVSVDQNGFSGSLVYTYCCKEQGIYEVGEVSAKNCKNDYPYAMALKRCFDRVVLKLSKLAYDGVYSDSEAEEFREPLEEAKEAKKELIDEKKIAILKGIMQTKGVSDKAILKKCKCETFDAITIDEYNKLVDGLGKMADK